MGAPSLQSIQELSVAERIQLVEDIWDSIAAAPETLGVTESQRQELDARLEEHRQDPDSGITWNEIKSRLQG